MPSGLKPDTGSLQAEWMRRVSSELAEMNVNSKNEAEKLHELDKDIIRLQVKTGTLNETVSKITVLEERIAALESGQAALNVKAGVFGGLAGLISVAIALAAGLLK